MGYDSSRSSRDYRFEIFIDKSLRRNDALQNSDDVASFLKRLPTIATTVNDGRGIPICYTLLPLTTFTHHLPSIDWTQRVVKPIDDGLINEIAQTLKGIDQSQ